MENDGTQGKTKAVWDPRTHEIWVDLATEQVRVGNRNGTHLSKQGWKIFIENFSNSTGRKYDQNQLKNHWDIVKKDWQVWDSLKLIMVKKVECSKRKEKTLQPNRKKFKKGKKKNNSTTSKLSKQLEELCESVKNMNSYIRTDPPSFSVQEVVEKLSTLPECEPM
ncbi:hypothetical protein Ddye_004927 [Dipteronia dyeriana]|uniref:Myb/SANT-like domain-containing protein n=1 Tax=Dipteronia dyeriana TaxID=168575 RepID=A0AAD9XFB3_9ROSI|nr:hypothetical protein Ddye_004927 [Dipteronia dyeriana]